MVECDKIWCELEILRYLKNKKDRIYTGSEEWKNKRKELEKNNWGNQLDKKIEKLKEEGRIKADPPPDFESGISIPSGGSERTTRYPLEIYKITKKGKEYLMELEEECGWDFKG